MKEPTASVRFPVTPEAHDRLKRAAAAQDLSPATFAKAKVFEAVQEFEATCCELEAERRADNGKGQQR